MFLESGITMVVCRINVQNFRVVKLLVAKRDSKIVILGLVLFINSYLTVSAIVCRALKIRVETKRGNVVRY